jgi:hypothetical protein
VFLTFRVPRRSPLSGVLLFNDELRQLLQHSPENLDESATWELIRAGLAPRNGGLFRVRVV